jgi:hypothetical protein
VDLREGARERVKGGGGGARGGGDVYADTVTGPRGHNLGPCERDSDPCERDGKSEGGRDRRTDGRTDGGREGWRDGGREGGREEKTASTDRQHPHGRLSASAWT